jgi:hypothetical protein
MDRIAWSFRRFDEKAIAAAETDRDINVSQAAAPN